MEPLEMRNTICKMENILDGLNARLDIREENLTDLEQIVIETIQSKIQIKYSEYD